MFFKSTTFAREQGQYSHLKLLDGASHKIFTKHQSQRILIYHTVQWIYMLKLLTTWSLLVVPSPVLILIPWLTHLFLITYEERTVDILILQLGKWCLQQWSLFSFTVSNQQSSDLNSRMSDTNTLTLSNRLYSLQTVSKTWRWYWFVIIHFFFLV